MSCYSLSVESKEQQDQATPLKKIFEEVQQTDNETEPDQEVESYQTFSEPKTEREMDVLNLPPRKEVHGKNQSRAKLKFHAPFMRLVLVVIVLIGVMSGAYFIWGEELISIINNR